MVEEINGLFENPWTSRLGSRRGADYFILKELCDCEQLNEENRTEVYIIINKNNI